jgi:hypothetical protein
MSPGVVSQNAFALVVSVLAPYLGENMARAAVEGHRAKLAVKGSSGTRAEVDLVLEALGPGLGVFVGRARTMLVLYEVRAALDLGGITR